MKQIKKGSLTLLALLLSALTSCTQKSEAPGQHRITVGITYQNLQNEFIVDLQDAVRAEAKKLNVDLVEADGQGHAEDQISQVQNFIARGVDVIILNPYDREASAPVVDAALQAHKPIVVVNSLVTNVAKANAYVGSENSESGRIAAQRVMDVLGGKGNIAVIDGPNGHSATAARSEGIRDVLAKYPDAHIVAEQSANWDRTQALNLMENWLASGRKIDAVIGENDEMALGAQKAIAVAGRQKEITIIGIDGIPDALKAVVDGRMTASVFQDATTQGTLALDVAVQLAQGKTVKHDNYIPFQLITKDNVAKFQKSN